MVEPLPSAPIVSVAVGLQAHATSSSPAAPRVLVDMPGKSTLWVKRVILAPPGPARHALHPRPRPSSPRSTAAESGCTSAAAAIAPANAAAIPARSTVLARTA